VSRKSYRNTKIILIFVVLLALAWAFNKAGLPFAKPELRGARNTDNLRDELLFRWDHAKRANYNAQFNLTMGINNFDSIADSLGFLDKYVKEHRGSKLSKYEYLVRVPINETEQFYNKITSLATLEKTSSDYSTALTAGSVQSYNDSLKVFQAKRAEIEKLRRENPNIKGYTQDIEEIDEQIRRINSLKFSLQNKDYDLYLIAFSEQSKKGVDSAEYIGELAKHFIIALGALALAVPLIILGSRLLFKVMGIVDSTTSQLYGSYYNKSSKYGSYGGYGYNYGRKRQVKRVYKDKTKGDEEKSPDKK